MASDGCCPGGFDLTTMNRSIPFVRLCTLAAALACSCGDAADSDLVQGLDVLDIDALPAPDVVPAVLPSCLGESRPLVISSVLPYADVAIGAASGAFLVDFATTRSTIDLAAFAAPPAALGCDPTFVGQACAFDGFDFFGSWSTVSLLTADHSGVNASVRQAGILGTDFLSVHAFTLDWTGGRILRARRADFCPDEALAEAGFVVLPCDGFYAADPAALRPLSDVVVGASLGARVPNVPTVPLRIAGVAAHAQLDTGFDDAIVPFSANVNEAFADAIAAADPDALVREPSKDLALSTCVPGVTEPVEAYVLAEGVAAGLVDGAGAIVRAWPSATIFVKRTPPSAFVCGGIGTWDAPAAQLSGSFTADLGAVVFDPFGGRVWVQLR